MNWQRIIEKYGWKMEEVGADPLQPLAVQAAQAKANQLGAARVSMTTGTSTDYGGIKISCTVSIDCLQSDSAIAMAGECAFMKSLELTNEGARYLGVPELPSPS